MILADKIITLRKQNGMSQDELAARMNVSRQSVSKWEGAQSAPDLNRILQLSEIFGVSTDTLLKDELDLAPAPLDLPDATDPPLHPVSMETANSFLLANRKAALLIPSGIACFISAVIPGILLEHLGSAGEVVGGVLLFVLIAAGIALCILGGSLSKPYEFLEHDGIDTAYGVSGMVREKKNQRQVHHLAELICGIALCVLSLIPMLVTGALFGEESLPASLGLAAMFVLIAAGVFLIVHTAILSGGFEKLLEEGSYSRAEKAAQNSLSHTVIRVYWLVVVAGFLGYSFLTNRWDRSWIIFPVAGVLCAALAAILNRIGH